MKTTILKSEKYVQELNSLKKDPIIMGMAMEIIGPMHDSPDEKFKEWVFISSASKEYHRRGGKNALSIGGPAAAILELVKELKRG